MSYNDNNIVIDVSHTKFCVGPCSSKEEESKVNIFKPKSGGRYKEFYYPLNKNSYLILKNVRICCDCNSRYLEFIDEEDNERLKQDSKMIRKKLKI